MAGSGGDRDLNGWWWRRHASQLTVTIWYLICFLIYTHNIQQGDQKIAGTKTSSQGQCLSPQCISGNIFVFFKYKCKKVFKSPQLSAQRSSEVSRRWFRAPRSPQTALRHKTQMARPEWKLKIDISQEWWMWDKEMPVMTFPFWSIANFFDAFPKPGKN